MKLISNKNRLLFLKISTLLMFLCVSYYYYPHKIEFLGHKNKTWAHQCNSTIKLNGALNYFKGVELDLIYDSELNSFDVSHYNSESTGLNFTTYLDSLNYDFKPNMWLDIKNLNERNASLIFQKLTSILLAKEFKYENIIIETRYPEALPIFTNNGFLTSYYLPYRLYKKDNDELKVVITNIKKVLAEQPNIAISTSHKNYEIVNYFFPKKTKYIWALVYPINFDFFIINKLLNDEKVKVVLVNYNFSNLINYLVK